MDFLIALLQTHAQTLQRLAALLGEETLLELLESMEATPEHNDKQCNKVEWIESTRSQSISGASPYVELEHAVHELNLPAMLEFHVWAYPHYRAFIESSLDLSARIRSQGSEAGQALVQEAVLQAQQWVRKLPLPPSLAAQAERAAEIPWIRFRSMVLKRIGKRPLGPVHR